MEQGQFVFGTAVVARAHAQYSDAQHPRSHSSAPSSSINALCFYRDVLGLAEQAAFASPDGRVTVLEAGRTTIELADPGHAAYIDEVEVGRRVAGRRRLTGRRTATGPSHGFVTDVHRELPGWARYTCSSTMPSAVERHHSATTTYFVANRGGGLENQDKPGHRGASWHLSDSQCNGLIRGHLFPLLPDQREIVV